MLHNVLSTIGLGFLGVDPITAIVLLGMGIRREKKYKITFFMGFYTVLSILIGAVLSAVFGADAVDILKGLVPSDEHPFWGAFELGISIVILIWTVSRICRPKKKEAKEEKLIDGSLSKFILTGVLFAFSCFTDPTYYAVILLGGETLNFLTATLLLTIWFVVSQFMALTVYFANQFGLLNRLTDWLDSIKQRFEGKPKRVFTYIGYTLLLIISVTLLVDSLFFWTTGSYLF